VGKLYVRGILGVHEPLNDRYPKHTI